MSERRPPLPIPPPPTNESHLDMVIKFAPTFPVSDFLGREDPRSAYRTSLPPINVARPPVTSQHDFSPPHPLQLAPLQALTPPQRVSLKPMSIAQLVTDDGLANQPGPVRSASRHIYRSPSESIASSPAEVRARSQPFDASQLNRLDHPPMLLHRLDHPPAPHRATSYRADQAQYLQPREPPPHPPQLHLTATSGSSASSYHDSQQSLSPGVSVMSTQTPTPTPQTIARLPFVFALSIRQQPVSARACGFGERDRRVIDPPPILELKITDRATGAPAQDHNAMHAMHCDLLSPDNNENQTEVPPAHPEMPSTRRLMGTLVASPYQAKDEHGVAGMFFVFPDLSCRSPGKYRLSFTLLRVDLMNMCAQQPTVAAISSDVFSVFTAKDFPGMRASSDLLKSLRKQGLNVGVKKGSEARKGKGKAKKGGSGDDDDSESDGSDAGRRGSDLIAGTGSTGGDVSPMTKTETRAKRRRRAS